MQDQHYKILKIWIFNQKRRSPRVNDTAETEKLHFRIKYLREFETLCKITLACESGS